MGTRQATSIAILTTIRNAFPASEPPDLGTLTSHPTCETCEALQAAFGGLPWQTVPGPLLDASADRIALFSAEAYRYYLPAFLSRAVAQAASDGFEASAALDFTVQSLCDEDRASDTWWADRMPRLTPLQKHAVRAFLEWVTRLLERDGETGRLLIQTRDALERSWSPPTRPSESHHELIRFPSRRA
jgi:hypothetical protein